MGGTLNGFKRNDMLSSKDRPGQHPAGRGATWAVSAARRQPGEMLTRGDVCHLHTDRGEAERCGALLRGAPDLVRLDELRPRVFVVVWSLSAAAGGRLRRPASAAEPRPNPATCRCCDYASGRGVHSCPCCPPTDLADDRLTCRRCDRPRRWRLAGA